MTRWRASPTDDPRARAVLIPLEPPADKLEGQRGYDDHRASVQDRRTHSGSSVEEIEIDEPTAGELCLQLHAARLCDSDDCYDTGTPSHEATELGSHASVRG
jgi:hypothetical protein